jgi:APA family basic amino acid/polyamine antiporter
MLPRNVFGTLFLVSVAFSGAIAMGIFRMPHEVAKAISDPRLFLAVWIGGSLYTLLSVAPMAELATSYPRSGGYYVFVRRALGEFVGFTVGYLDWTTVVAAVALISMVVSEQIVNLVSASSSGTMMVSIILVLLVTLVNLGEARFTQVFHIGISVVKALAFLLIVVGLGMTSIDGSNGNVPNSQGGVSFTNLFLAFQAVIATYGGWEMSAYYAGETVSSRKVIPRALFGSVLVIMAVYLSMNVVLVKVLPMSDIATTAMPFNLAMERAFGSSGGMLLSSLMIVIMVSALIACSLGASRVLYALASDGLAISTLARTNDRGVPVVSLLTGAALAILFIVTGTFGRVLSVLALFRMLMYLLCVVSVFALRKSDPTNGDVYRTPGHPWTTALLAVVTGVFVVSALSVDTYNSVFGLCVAVGGTPLYFIAKHRSRKAAVST